MHPREIPGKWSVPEFFLPTLASRVKRAHHGRMNMPRPADHGRIVTGSDDCLNPLQLHELEEEFRRWTGASKRADVTAARKRVLLIFLLIRHTGAKLHEVLALNPDVDIDHERLMVSFGRRGGEQGRSVPLAGPLAREILALATEVDFRKGVTLHVDPAFVRRKFYERALACGFPKNLGSPEMIRKSRGVELMQSNMPLPAVQVYLGHSSPNLTSAYVSFSRREIQAITASFLERESARRTSARNSFFGKITRIRHSDIQALVELTTPEGHVVSSIITQESLNILGLQEGRLAAVEVKASWLSLEKSDTEPLSSAENRIPGLIARVTCGELTTECAVAIGTGTVLCALVTTESARRLDLRQGDRIWAVFSCHAAVVRVD